MSPPGSEGSLRGTAFGIASQQYRSITKLEPQDDRVLVEVVTTNAVACSTVNLAPSPSIVGSPGGGDAVAPASTGGAYNPLCAG